MDSTTYSFNRVMIIDDTMVDRYLASFILKKYKFATDIIEFDMATKAIAFLDQNQDNPEKLPQVILLDIRMPEMDGFQFLERLAKLPQSIKQSCCIIMVSSSLDPDDHKRAEDNTVVKKFVNKPLSENKLREIYELFKNSNLEMPPDKVGLSVKNSG